MGGLHCKTKRDAYELLVVFGQTVVECQVY